ncbi:importin subunit alpha-1-like isoform X2 [Daphnia pulex]|uniref:importin subunit alpha-1-like isoform X2 n=1 Tax=Daphnia pulex TaxID=6669 RepID=UPI001EDFADE2|nr:importin subunit alpha-1-like isoform X2 [Daphnia pulex]
MTTEANPTLLKDINHNCRGYEEVKKEDHMLYNRYNQYILEVYDEDLSPLEVLKCMAAAKSIEDIVNGINSGDVNKEITATNAIRKFLSEEHNPALIRILINANVVPKLVEFLSRVKNAELQLESARTLTTIVLCRSFQVQAVVSAGAIAGFMSMLSSPHPVTAEQAVRALGIIAKDGPKLRDYLIEQGFIKAMLSLVKSNSSATLLRSVTSTLSNLCRYLGGSVLAVRQLLPALYHLIHANDEEILATACMALSHLTDGPKEIKKEVINAGVVPRLVELFYHKEETVIYPTLMVIGYIAYSGEDISDEIEAFVSAGAVAGMIHLLDSPHPVVVEHAAWVLGNFANQGAEIRDFLIEEGIIKPLVSLINKPDTPVKLLQEVTVTLTNLCGGYEDSPLSVPAVRQLIPALAHLLNSNDSDILVCASMALSNLSADGHDERIQDVVDTGVVPRLISLLDKNRLNDDFVISMALSIIANIVTANDSQTDSVLAAGACPALAKLLAHSDLEIVKRAARTVAKIAAGNATQIQALITNNVIRPLVDVLGNGDFKCQKAAALAITNITMGGNVEQIALLCQFGAVAPLCTLLETKKPKTIVVVLDCLANILAAAKKMGELEKVSLDVRVCGGLDLIEVLVIHNNVDISLKSLAVLKQYFSTDRDEDSELAPSISQSGNYEFNTQPFQTPEGGFSF